MSADLLTPLWHPDAALPHLDAQGWERLLRQARLGALVPRVAMRFDTQGGLGRLPDGPRHHLENGLRLAQRQVQAVRWEVERIRRAVAPTGTPVVLLKGAAYLLAGLPAAQGRLFADIDILVPRDRLEIVEVALLGAGWVSRERDRYNQRYYRVWMHELPPLEHVKRSTVIDVHHTITPPTSSFNVDGRLLLAQSRPLAGHEGLAVLQPVDMLLHSMVHLFQEGDFDHGLRDLIDMHALLVHFEAQDTGFWPQLTARARQLGLGVPLVQALDHVASGQVWVGESLLSRLLSDVTRRLEPKAGWESTLTSREVEVAQRASLGHSNQLIANDLGITERTVRAHLQAVFEKLNVTDRLMLALKVHGIA